MRPLNRKTISIHKPTNRLQTHIHSLTTHSADRRPTLSYTPRALILTIGTGSIRASFPTQIPCDMTTPYLQATIKAS